MPVKVDVDDGIATVRMEEPRGNALGPACLAALHAAFDEVAARGSRACVLTGKGAVFSVGLDLKEAFDYDRAAMTRYVEAFEDLFLRAFLLPLPVVAAINGHAIAGGCVLALACDAQLATAGEYGIGVNEVQLGIPFPSCAFEVSRYGVPSSSWSEAFLEGRRFLPAEARAAGVVEAVVPGDVVAAAQAKARVLAQGGRDALRIVKHDLKRAAADRARARADASRAAFLDAWFGEDARARIGAVRAALKA